MRPATKGITLTEVIITAAIFGIVALGVVKGNSILLRLNQSLQHTQMMSYDALSIMTHIATQAKECGDGLRGASSPAFGTTVIALPDNPLLTMSPEIIFLRKDESPIGSMGPEDLWMRYSAGTQDSRDGLWVRLYRSSNWLDIKSGEVQAEASEFIKTSHGVQIERLSFTLFDSQHPPRIANQDPYATSSVRVGLVLKKGGTSFQQEKTITLENLLYGPI